MKSKPSSVPEIIKNLNPVTEQFGPLSHNSDQMQIPDAEGAEDIEDAAEIGGNAMAASEPFGPAIGATVGAAEESLSLLKKKKPIS